MPTVLIIESDAAVAKHLTTLLGAKRIESKVTADGSEGVNLARTAQPAVIVLCVELSRVSGYSICNKLKKDPELGKIPLILTSSQATEETFEQHKKLKTRAEAYLKKPFTDAEMMGLITKYVAGGAAPADEVSLDEVSVELDDASGGGGGGASVDVDSVVFGGNAGLELEPPAAHKPAPRVAANETVVMTRPALAAARAAARPGATTAAADGQVEQARNESKQLRQKIQQLEQQLEQKELEFNDRLLQESSRSREAVEAKKKLALLERDMAKYKEAAEKAKAEVAELRGELDKNKVEGRSVDAEKQTMATKIGQLVDKVKALAAERDGLQQEIERLQSEAAGAREESENAAKVREKAKKAVDIALQLLGETGLVQ